MLRVNGLYGYIKHNAARSLALFGFFIPAYAIAMFGLVALVVYFLNMGPSLKEAAAPWALAMLCLIIVLSQFLMSLHGHLKAIRNNYGLLSLQRSQARELHNLVETLAITTGLPTPKIAIIESPALNAFAYGATQRGATIVVTRGLLSSLTPKEIEAVLAHEIVHIRNGDVAFMAYANAWTTSLLALHAGVKDSAAQNPLLAILHKPFLAIGLAAARVTKLLISEKREFNADAGAIEITKNPAALISALKKIEGRSRLEGTDMVLDGMLIDGETEGAQATHPTIARRIQNLIAVAGPLIASGASLVDALRGDAPGARPGFGRKGVVAALAPAEDRGERLGQLLRTAAAGASEDELERARDLGGMRMGFAGKAVSFAIGTVVMIIVAFSAPRGGTFCSSCDAKPKAAAQPAFGAPAPGERPQPLAAPRPELDKTIYSMDAAPIAPTAQATSPPPATSVPASASAPAATPASARSASPSAGASLPQAMQPATRARAQTQASPAAPGKLESRAKTNDRAQAEERRNSQDRAKPSAAQTPPRADGPPGRSVRDLGGGAKVFY
jgi:heat shock protein HtpX